jgi:hypothetical protein
MLQDANVRIADRLNTARRRLHIARLACEGMQDEGGEMVAELIAEIGDELEAVSGELHPEAGK